MAEADLEALTPDGEPAEATGAAAARKAQPDVFTPRTTEWPRRTANVRVGDEKAARQAWLLAGEEVDGRALA